ncbi:MAG: hypothetical protein H6Q60_819 [Oscillospiraceae bacterium]|nr:hypothetical protein [Oscillospiraceae bacterium]
MNNRKTPVEFAKDTVINNYPQLNFIARELLAIADCGACIAYDKFWALHTQIIFGATECLAAYDLEQKDALGRQSDTPWFERTMHLQNAILSYNSCLDYMWQVIYFYYDIGNVKYLEFSDFSNIEEESSKIGKKVSYKELKKAMALHNPLLLSAIESYQKKREHNNEMANMAKHRASFWAFGNSRTGTGATIVNTAGQEINITSITTPPTIDIDHEVELLTNFHKDTVEMEKTVYECCDFKSKLYVLGSLKGGKLTL